MQLTQGQKTPLSAIGVGNRLTVDVDFGGEGLDVVVFGLDSDKKISDDRYTVLFSNPRSPSGEIVMTGTTDSTSFEIDLQALPQSVQRLMIVASHDTRPLETVTPLVVSIGQGATFDAGRVAGQERALMLVELYLHGGQWRVAAVGQGFAQGLAKLIEHLGGDVSPPTGGGSVRESNAAPAAGVTAPSLSPGISLEKITLEKRKSVSLEKGNGRFGDIVLNLRWAQRRGGGFFGGGKGIDLDLGCLYELQNGDKGVVQALGHSYGSYDYDPYIELDGDDRSGSNANGETIRINGNRFGEIRRLAVFALIYDGAVRWSETDARASIKMPGQPEVVVEIHDGDNRKPLYGMAIIENDRGSMRITNHAIAYRDQKQFADDIGIHLRWTNGTKD